MANYEPSKEIHVSLHYFLSRSVSPSLKINLPPTTSFERQEDVIFHSLFNRLHEAKLTKKKKVDHTKNIKDKTVPRTGIFFTLEKRSYIF